MRLIIFLSCFMLFSSGIKADIPPLAVQSVADGVYVHPGINQLPDTRNRGEIANIGFVVGERCVAVIDSGGSPEQGQALKATIVATTSVPICYVINTHVHPDHVYGNIAFKTEGVRFVGHHKLAWAMAVRAPYYQQKALSDLGVTLEASHFIPPDISVTDTLNLDLGGRSLQLIAHPTAHTDNDLTVFDDKTHTLWLADLLFMGHIPVVDGSLNGWLNVLERLAGIKAERAVPGHGPVTANWPEALNAERGYLLQLRQEIRAALAAGKTMEQTLSETRAEHYDHWNLFEAFHLRNVSTAFAELEWE
ncbi:MAG: quinoprotein relay system zinc metallohydrolase 2 [Methylococcaceae bacterium]